MIDYILIPANMDSKRLPGKPLQYLDLATKKTVLDFTYRNIWEKISNQVVHVITDSEDIKIHCKKNSYSILMTGEAENGTHRCSLVIKELRQPDIVVNWQIDYPFVDFNDIALGIELCRETRDIITFRFIGNENHLHQNYVKVVGYGTNTWYFSRSIIPNGTHFPNIHVGIYIFPIEFLIEFREQKLLGWNSNIGTIERLEQLDFMAMDWKIRCLNIEPTLSINTRLDLENARKKVQENVQNFYR